MAAAQSPFEELDQRRAFEKIVGQIEGAILRGELRPGDRLPSERELAETFAASRASVREALRVLESFGVVVAKRGAGPNAGSTVAEEAQIGLQSALRLYSGLMQISTKEIVDVRAVLEGHAAEMAAKNAQDEDIDRLRAIIGQMASAETIETYHDLDTAFHVELARASGSTLLPVLMEALRASMGRVMLEALAAREEWTADRDRLLIEHEAIVDHLEKGDPAGTKETVLLHVRDFYRDVVDESDETPHGRGSAGKASRRKRDD